MRFSLLITALFFCLSLWMAGRAAASDPAAADSAANAPASAAEQADSDAGLAELTGTVRHVDQAAHSFHLETPDGTRMRFVAGPHVAVYNSHNEAEPFDALRENDRVRVRYDAKTLVTKEINEL